MTRIAAFEREMRVQTICMAIGVGFLALLSLYLLQAVLIPFVMAIFIVSGLTPVLSRIEARLSTTRLVAVVIATLMGFVLVFVLWSIIWISVAQLREDGGKYVHGVKAWTIWATSSIDGFRGAFRGWNFDEEPTSKMDDPAAAPKIEEAATPEAVSLEELSNNGNRTNQGLSNQEHGLTGSVAQMIDDGVKITLTTMMMWISTVLQTGTMVVIFVFFLLLGSSQTTLPGDTWKEIDTKIREYIVSKSLISFFTGLVFGIVLWLFGIPLAAVFALLAFLFNFIPNIGPIFACLLPLPLIILDPDLAVWQMVLVTILASTVQIVSGNVIEPRMMGDSFDVHPIAILLALMFWSVIWGMIGMFLAVPMTAVMKILFAKFELTKPLADLLAGRIDGLSFKNFKFGGSASE